MDSVQAGDITDDPKTPPPTHKFMGNGNGTLKLTVLVLGLVAMTAIASIAFLSQMGKEPPEGMLALASAAVGGLATLLNSSTK